jgi:flavin reductase (DIM6/NTAB) family NADH-FMN oxidoreductase RutF
VIEVNRVHGHRVMGPRVVFLLGTRSLQGHGNCIPICNVGIVGSDPELVSIAVYKQWQSCENLREANGFTLSVPRATDLPVVWMLGGKYSGYAKVSDTPKMKEFAERLDEGFSERGPVLVGALAWIDCRVIRRIEEVSDHLIVLGEIERCTVGSDFYDTQGRPYGGVAPLMQWSGNLFTAPGPLRVVDFFVPTEARNS